MRLIDADALEKFLADAEMEATMRRKYVLAGALNMIQGNVRNFPTIEPETNWISCKERLPEKPYGCLATVWDSTLTGEGDDFENLLPYFVGWDGEQWNDEDGQQCPFEVIAWMPLPPCYRGNENDK